MKPREVLEMLRRLDTHPVLGSESDRLCQLDLHVQTCRDDAALRDVLAEYMDTFPTAQGWLCRQSDVVHFKDGACPLDAMIQYGEISGDALNGLLIRPDGAGGWKLVHQMEREGDSHLAVAHRHVGRRRAPSGSPAGDLLYCCYWAPDPELGYRSVTARLVRFEKSEVTS